MTKGWYEFICRSILPTTNRSELTVERAVLIHSIIIGENINVEEIIADQIYNIIAALCADGKIPAILDDTLIPQELPIVGVAMTRTREARARNPRQARQATPPQQEPPQEQPQPQVHHQQDFPSNFYTHFDAFMSQIYRRLNQQQEENRKSFEAINTRMDRMDDQLSFLQREEEMNQERMRYDQILQEAAAQQAREANKGKSREVVPDSEEEFVSSESEEW
ncbi:hypothetical protein PIB30_065075 [Stylosanthes scabra]|uniref:Uncharacterized protein n=1 Tax=Stylosanthes scabra TaxID=79078 RepID=A0ABU6ZKK6_9FABA|nr:hypothetical protein [Stylosanthes scabra]